MKYTVYDRLLQREVGGRTRYSSLRGIYGDRQWIENMDIVNELEGHNGCVNALRYAQRQPSIFVSLDFPTNILP